MPQQLLSITAAFQECCFAAAVNAAVSAAAALLLPSNVFATYMQTQGLEHNAAVTHILIMSLLLSPCCCQDEEGIDPSRVFPISAVTGRGVREVVAAVRSVLDELGPAEVVPETNALNLTSVPRRFAPEVNMLCCAMLCYVL
jgi:hypothetical protein